MTAASGGTMLGAVVAEAAVRYRDRPAYVSPDGGTLSYVELDKLSDQVAAGLLGLGLGPGHVLALLLPSGPSYALAYVAAAKIGAVTAGVNDKLSPPERRRCLEIARPRLVLASADLAATTGLASLSDVGPVIEVDTDGAPVEALAVLGHGPDTLPRLDPDPDRPVAVVFTSGTTGAPKGAVFCERQLDAISEADGGRRWGQGGRSLASTSFAHLGYMTKLPQALRGGGTSFLMSRWSAGAALDMVATHRLTNLGGIPTQVALMLAHQSFDRTDLSSLRLIALGGGPATAALVRETRRRFGVPVVVRYTCTEAGVGVGTVADDPPEDAEESVGRARAGVEVTLRDEAGAVLPAGTTGEICLASAAVMARYHRDPAATAAVLTVDGAVRTGDLGYLDDRGRLHLAGRSKEMYVRGGYNVFPQEVEEVLADHPAVAHLAVAPRPDDVMGEIGVAVIVLRTGAPSPTLESLRAHARNRLATHKLPEALVLVDELPRTAMEKLDRRALAQLVAAPLPASDRPD